MEDLRDHKEVAKATSASAEFSDVLDTLQDALRSAIKAFAAHYAADGKITREQWIKWNADEVPSQEYLDGFNAGVESVVSGAETFLDEFRYY